MLLPSQSSLWADKLQETEKTISNTTWSLQTGFEFRGGGAASSGKSSSLSLLLGRGWKMTHMHCGLDKNRPLHRSTNPARMRLNVWSMVITSCREQCPPPGLQQRADKAVSWWARVHFSLFSLCWTFPAVQQMRENTGWSPYQSSSCCREVFVLSAQQLHSLHVKLCF